MLITAISGSPSARSRSNALLQLLTRRLGDYGIKVNHFAISDFDADAVFAAKFDAPSIVALKNSIVASQGLVVSTPVYKASFSGVLKAVLDLLPESALNDRAALPFATAGSPAHILALEYSLKPVLAALGARHVLNGVYATEQQIRWLDDGQIEVDEEIQLRVNDAATRLIESIVSFTPRRTSFQPGLTQPGPGLQALLDGSLAISV